MWTLPIVSLALSGTVLALENVRGVPNSKLDLYRGENGLFECLDGAQKIPLDRVNDDYCDCEDGSDEPGTSACSNGYFFCQNAGHIPGYIRSSRVNDGVCEEDCCDGSDEWLNLTKCPNICKEKAKQYAQDKAEEESTRASGWKVKEGWLKTAHRLRLELEDELQRSVSRLQAVRVNLKDKEASLEKLQIESHGDASADASDNAIEMTLLKFKAALGLLRDQATEQERRIAEYEAILRDLSQGYNPNFQDMAVKGAVTTFSDLKPLTETGITQEALQELLEATVEYQSPSIVPNVSSGTFRAWESLRSKLIDFGILQRDSFDPADVLETKQLVKTKATTEKIREEVAQLERDVSDIQDNLARNFGEGDVYRAVKGQCFSSLISDYTYEVCLLDNLHQKSSSLHTLVGKFDHIDENGSLIYQNGQKCWNGPERSGRVDLECGRQNELISVREAQKCEYVFRVKSPLACFGPETPQRDEL